MQESVFAGLHYCFYKGFVYFCAKTNISMITFPVSKINLGLNIVGKRPDGYHDLETIFYPIPLKDALEIIVPENPTEKVIVRQTGIVATGNPQDNLVVKAYNLLDKEFDLSPVEIYLHKTIPTGAGLGGGSSDAAFMLKMLNEQFKLNLTSGQLENYAAILGADCAFFIESKPSFAEGIGNIFTPVKTDLSGYHLVVVKPDVFVSTKEAFSYVRPAKPSVSLKEIVNHPVKEWKEYMFNDFEQSVFKQFPVIGGIKDRLYELGAVYASMSGSGASVYALFSTEKSLPDFIFPGCFVFQSTL